MATIAAIGLTTVRPGTVAAVVVANERTLQARNLGTGAEVSVRRTHHDDLPGRITAMTCQKERCTVVVALDALPPEKLDLHSFSTADLEARPK
jgi:hypothetical protein